ncbi:MAG: hormogonium polysaccharide secretion pseudopilin HpsC [Nostocaceae cyanobacterium]|nr:hormogonium polysaccharide secretion pseudopilin HpsC [Nostocaceae cyanobacterium]
MNIIKFLLKKPIKKPKYKKTSGFTLAELLVALILGSLIITPLLGLMVNVLNTDNQEQAKLNSEQEIQSALDYITRDLQQAIYIYDATGINAIKDQLPNSDKTDRVPVLVFWKREFLDDAVVATNGGKDDAFVYSLVAYYLIKDTNKTWSNAARIARWEIRDGVEVTSGGVDCPGYTSKYAKDYCPSDGFSLFSLEGVGTLEQKMNKWTKASEDYDKSPSVLVDYIDQTTSGMPDATCSPDSTKPKITWSKLPQDIEGFKDRNTAKMTGFYACVDTDNTTAEIFIRGNAIARIDNNNLDYKGDKKNYFPSASIRVEGRGFLFTK